MARTREDYSEFEELANRYGQGSQVYDKIMPLNLSKSVLAELMGNLDRTQMMSSYQRQKSLRDKQRELEMESQEPEFIDWMNVVLGGAKAGKQIYDYAAPKKKKVVN